MHLRLGLLASALRVIVYSCQIAMKIASTLGFPVLVVSADL